MATAALRRLRTACIGHFGDLGIMAEEECIEAASHASSLVNKIPEFGRQIESLNS